MLPSGSPALEDEILFNSLLSEASLFRFLASEDELSYDLIWWNVLVSIPS